jgi:hypothetical protein
VNSQRRRITEGCRECKFLLASSMEQRVNGMELSSKGSYRTAVSERFSTMAS